MPLTLPMTGQQLADGVNEIEAEALAAKEKLAAPVIYDVATREIVVDDRRVQLPYAYVGENGNPEAGGFAGLFPAQDAAIVAGYLLDLPEADYAFFEDEPLRRGRRYRVRSASVRNTPLGARYGSVHVLDVDGELLRYIYHEMPSQSDGEPPRIWDAQRYLDGTWTGWIQRPSGADIDSEHQHIAQLMAVKEAQIAALTADNTQMTSSVAALQGVVADLLTRLIALEVSTGPEPTGVVVDQVPSITGDARVDALNLAIGNPIARGPEGYTVQIALRRWQRHNGSAYVNFSSPTEGGVYLTRSGLEAGLQVRVHFQLGLFQSGELVAGSIVDVYTDPVTLTAAPVELLPVQLTVEDIAGFWAADAIPAGRLSVTASQHIPAPPAGWELVRTGSHTAFNGQDDWNPAFWAPIGIGQTVTTNNPLDGVAGHNPEAPAFIQMGWRLVGTLDVLYRTPVIEIPSWESSVGTGSQPPDPDPDPAQTALQVVTLPIIGGSPTLDNMTLTVSNAVVTGPPGADIRIALRRWMYHDGSDWVYFSPSEGGTSFSKAGRAAGTRVRVRQQWGIWEHGAFVSSSLILVHSTEVVLVADTSTPPSGWVVVQDPVQNLSQFYNACRNAAAGEKVLIAGGNYATTGDPVASQMSAQRASPALFTAQNPANPPVFGYRPIFLQNARGYIFENLRFTWLPTNDTGPFVERRGRSYPEFQPAISNSLEGYTAHPGNGHGRAFRINSCSDIEIVGCLISGYMECITMSFCSNTRIAWNTFDRNRGDIIRCFGSGPNHVVEHNHMQRCRPDWSRLRPPSNPTQGFHPDFFQAALNNADAGGGLSDVFIRKNTIYNHEAFKWFPRYYTDSGAWRADPTYDTPGNFQTIIILSEKFLKGGGAADAMHRNIVVEDNDIINSMGNGVYYVGVRSSSIQRNRFRSTTGTRGSATGPVFSDFPLLASGNKISSIPDGRPTIQLGTSEPGVTANAHNRDVTVGQNWGPRNVSRVASREHNVTWQQITGNSDGDAVPSGFIVPVSGHMNYASPY